MPHNQKTYTNSTQQKHRGIGTTEVINSKIEIKDIVLDWDLAGYEVMEPFHNHLTLKEIEKRHKE